MRRRTLVRRAGGRGWGGGGALQHSDEGGRQERVVRVVGMNNELQQHIRTPRHCEGSHSPHRRHSEQRAKRTPGGDRMRGDRWIFDAELESTCTQTRIHMRSDRGGRTCAHKQSPAAFCERK